MKTPDARWFSLFLLSAVIAVGPAARAADPAGIRVAKAIGLESAAPAAKPSAQPAATPETPAQTLPADAVSETPVTPAKAASSGISKTWIWVGAGVAALLAAAAGGGGGGGGTAISHP